MDTKDIDIDNPMDFAVDEDGIITDPVELKEFRKTVVSINDYPPYVPEEENEDILIRGRWLERGGSAWWISTAGTGKSIASVQLAYRWGAGLAFAGLTPRQPLRTWIFQSEDSPSRIAIDRDDIVAELAEQEPSVNWHSVGRNCVKFVKFKNGQGEVVSHVGVAFLKAVDDLLDLATKHNQKPDVILINPFMAFVGGPVSDGSYVTPFLRGGDINHEHTDGMQHLLEKHNVAALIFHHTPKPPTEKEIEGWLKSTFPEYQGAGSSDITNWGRSFITMMKVKNHPRMVCLVAGKNGNEIGWQEYHGTRRRYLSYSEGTSVTGGGRHAWRELTDEELMSVAGEGEADHSQAIEEVAYHLAEDLKKEAARFSDIEGRFAGRFSRQRIREAFRVIQDRPSKFQLTIKPICIGNIWTKLVGLAPGIVTLERTMKDEAKLKEAMNDGRDKGGDSDQHTEF